MRTLEFSTRTAFACEAMLVGQLCPLRAAVGHFVRDDQIMLGKDFTIRRSDYWPWLTALPWFALMWNPPNFIRSSSIIYSG